MFGAFLLGVAVPRGDFAAECRRLLEPPVIVLLLPVYFVYSGLNTRISLLLGGGVVGAATLILVAAFVAKGVGSPRTVRALGRELETRSTPAL